MGGLTCHCSDVMMASCDVDNGSWSLVALILCVALALYALRWSDCCDGYESDSDEEGEVSEAARSMFS